MLKQKVAFIFLALFTVACGPDAETYLDRAGKALKTEGSHSALPLYQRAFDLSLPDEFYLTDSDELYSQVSVSLNGQKVILAQTRADGKESAIHILDTAEGEGQSRKIEGSVRFSALSPRGEYAVLIVSATVTTETPVVEADCLLVAGNSKQDEFSFHEAINCMEKPGVSDRGLLYYMKEGKIYSVDLARNLKPRLLSEKTPDAPASGVPAWGWFQFALDDVAFFTYGSAGIYKLYRLNSGDFNLLSKTGAFGRIYFIGNGPHPGIITGGASAHRAEFFNRESGKTVHQFPIHFWIDAAFFSKENYYYLENSRLYASGEKEFPIWASKIYPASGNRLLILTPQGALLRFGGEAVPAESKKIFLKGWDL